MNKTLNKTMNTLNFTFHFNAPVGQNIAHVDTLEAHFDKDMTMQVVDTKAMEASPRPSPATPSPYGYSPLKRGEFRGLQTSLNEERLECAVNAMSPLPEVLLTNEARELHARLVEAGMVDEGWMPVGLTGAERGVLVFQLAVRLDIQNLWQVFAPLWGTTPGALRSAYNRANEQRKTLSFIEKLKSVLN